MLAAAHGSSAAAMRAMMLTLALALPVVGPALATHPPLYVFVGKFAGSAGVYDGWVGYDVCSGFYATVYVEGITPAPDSFPVKSVKTPNMCLPGPFGPFLLGAAAWNLEKGFTLAGLGAGATGVSLSSQERAYLGSYGDYAYAVGRSYLSTPP